MTSDQKRTTTKKSPSLRQKHSEALIRAQDYLSRAQKSRKGKTDRYTSIALQIMKGAIDASVPKKSSAKRQTRERTPDRDPSSPDDDDDKDDRRTRSDK